MGKPKRIILLRHGQSEGNVDHTIYEHTPDYALHLTDVGRTQSIDAGKQIQNIIQNESLIAYVSPFYRTRETYQGLATVLQDQITQMYEDPRLREQEWGHYRPTEETCILRQERTEYSPFYYRLQNGESAADVYDRISTFLETLYRDFSNDAYADNVVIVTHGMTLRVFLMRWFHWSPEQFEAVKNPNNCQYVILQLQPSGYYELIQGLAYRTQV